MNLFNLDYVVRAIHDQGNFAHFHEENERTKVSIARRHQDSLLHNHPTARDSFGGIHFRTLFP
ncbi:MAG: hypothetical protein D4R83_01000 [Streptomycetaceae bacterium]|nr:MAG: hypothetical protein D4R83_01000 [Streptomycetaceae bacterium]